MGLVRDSKDVGKIVIFALLGIFVFIMPWSSFFTLPDFLWFLDNTTLAAYLLGKHYQLLIYFVMITGAFLIPYVIYKAK